jgi:hypothetical protein
MNKNKKIGLIVAGIVVLIGVFYGGMFYGKSQGNSRGPEGFSANMQNRDVQLGGIAGGKNQMGGGGFTSGEVVSKDDKSITMKLADGGSKIIFLDNNTKVSKTVNGKTADLTIGEQVSITGTANSDGSITAQSVQIRTLPLLAK